MGFKKFISELKRRNLYKVSMTYAIVGWLVIQFTDTVFPRLNFPDWTASFAVILIVIGFPIALILAWAFEMSPEGVIRTTSVASQENPYSPGKKKPFTSNIIIVVLLFALVGQFTFNKYSNRKQNSGTVMEKTIAVLPFHNDSAIEENLYFCNGMVEEILNYLQKIAELQVKSRTSIEKYRNPKRNIKEIASELGVNYVVEGSVRKSGEQLRITAQLIDAQSGNHLWSETYDGKYTEAIFEFQTDIAKRIAGSLNAIITPTENKKISKAPSSNIIAYDYILQAREEQRKFWNSRYRDSLALKRAENLYNKVMKLDPEYAPSWIYKGSIYMDRHVTKDFFKENYLDSVVWYCNKALGYDKDNDHAYHLKGMTYHIRGDIDLAIKNYKRALELNTNDLKVRYETLWRLGYIYLCKKDFIKGISMIKEAVDSSKENPGSRGQFLFILAHAYSFIGAYEKAEKIYDQFDSCSRLCEMEFHKGNFEASLECFNSCCQNNSCKEFKAEIYLQLEDFDKSAEIFKKIRETKNYFNPNFYQSFYREAYVLKQLGKQKEAADLISRQITILDKNSQLDRPYDYDYHYAAIYTLQGDKKRAIKHLIMYDRKMLDPNMRKIPISMAQYDILFKSLWEDNDFKALMKKDKEEKAAARAALKLVMDRREED